MTSFKDTFNQKLIGADAPLGVLIDNIQEPPAGSRILDIGSQETQFPDTLAKLGYEVWGIDVRPQPNPVNYNFIQGNIQDIKLPYSYFDIVTDICALHHFGLGYYLDRKQDDADIEAVDKIYEALKPDGIFYSCSDRFGEEKAGFFRLYTVDIIRERLCRNKFVIEQSIVGKIGFVKMRRI